MKNKTKRLLIAAIILVSFILYTLAMDPDTNILNNLPFGAGVLLSLQIVLMFAIGLAVVEIITDFFTDRYFKLFDNKEIIDKMKESSLGLAVYMLGWSVRILGYAVMFGLIVLAYIGNQ